MAWTKFWDGYWYNDTTGEHRETTGDPNQEDAAQLATQPKWVQEGWQVVSGDPSGSGVSQTAVINPATGQAETLIQVATAPDANGIRQDLGTVPYSEYQAMAAQDPTITVARALPSPENSMIQSDLGSQIMEGIQEVGPIALSMALPGVISPYLSSALGTSPLFSNALASGASSLLTGGDPLQSALSSLAMGGLGGIGGDAAAVDANAYDAMQFGTPDGGLVGLGGAADTSVGALDALNYASMGGAQSAPVQLAGGTYGDNTTMTDVVPQVNYGLPDTGMLGNGLQLPTYTNPNTEANLLGVGGANPESNMGFNTSGTNVGANSTIGEGFNANAYLPSFGGNFNLDGAVQPGVNLGAAMGTGGTAPVATVPPVTPPPTAPDLSNLLIPAAVGAGTAAVLGGTGGSGTITSGGDVDLTGVGTNPNPYNNVDTSSWGEIPDWMKAMGIRSWQQLAGGALPSLLGAYASNEQTKTLRDLAQQYADYGAPSRARYEASMTPGFDPNQIAGYAGALDTAANALQRRLSTQGNPFGNPGGQIEANKQIVAGTALPAIQDYQRMNAGTGGLANLAAAYPQTQLAAAGSQGNTYNAIGYGVDQVLNGPKTSLNDLLKLINTGNRTA